MKPSFFSASKKQVAFWTSVLLLGMLSVLAFAAPGIPTGLVATSGNAQVALTWNAVSGATGYNVYRSITSASTGFSKFNASPITVSNFTNTGLTNGSSYWYKVSAVDGIGESGQTSSVAGNPVAAPATPTGLTATVVSEAQINLSWTATSTATGYDVQRSTDNATWTMLSTNQAGTSYSATGLTAFTTYYFRIRANNAGGSSAYTASINAKTKLAKPVVAATAGNAQVSLSWGAITGATNYTVLRSASSTGTYSSVASAITTTSYTNMGLTNGTPYYYKVYASNSVPAQQSADSAVVSATPALPPAPSTPTGLAASVVSEIQINLTWTATATATGYDVQRSTDNATWTTLSTNQAGTSYSATGLTAFTTYYFRIRANNAGGASSYTASINAKTKLAKPVVTATAGNSQVSLSWGAITGATNYTVLRSASSTGTYSSVASAITTTSYINTGLTNGTPYYYKVYASNSVAAQQSADSAVVSATPVAPPFHVTSLTNGQTLSDEIEVAAQVSSTSIEYGSVKMKVDGVEAATSAVFKDATSAKALRLGVDTNEFANGSHTLSFTNGTYTESYTVVFNNDVQNLKYDEVFDASAEFSDIPATAKIEADIVNPTTYPRWTVTISDLDGAVVRTYTGTTSHVNVTWDGKNTSGTVVEDSPYQITVAPETGSSLRGASFQEASFNSSQKAQFHTADFSSDNRPRFRLVQTTTPRKPKRTVSKARPSADTMIVLDIAAFSGGRTTAVNYWKYLKGQLTLPRMSGAFATPISGIIVGSSFKALALNGVTAKYIDRGFTTRKKLIYVDSHGGANHGVAGVPFFGIGPNIWYSDNSAAVASAGERNVAAMVAPLSYGSDPIEPPRLVWMDHCDSHGSPGAESNLWASAFGMLNSVGGACVTWNDSAIFYGIGTPRAWDMWRVNFWNISIAGGQNIQTTFNRCNSPGVTPQDAGYNPHTQSRLDGDGTVAFP